MSERSGELPGDAPGGGPPSGEPPRITRRQVVIQVVGFLVGVGLLCWCVVVAARGAEWDLVLKADRRLVMALLATTLASVVINAGMFWCVLRPVYRHSVRRLTLLNSVAGLFNYAPIRLGLILRVAYHLRVDPLSAATIAAWMLATAAIMAAALGAATIGGLIGMPSIGWTVAITLGAVAAAHAAIVLAMQIPAARSVANRLDGLQPMLETPWSYWATSILRLLDVLCFALRMWIADLILGTEIPAADILLLALAAQLISLSPVGRLGFREAAVAFLATRLQSGGDSVGLDATFTQLALIESAGEAAVLIPAGLIAMPWYLASMRKRRPRPPAAHGAGSASVGAGAPGPGAAASDAAGPAAAGSRAAGSNAPGTRAVKVQAADAEARPTAPRASLIDHDRGTSGAGAAPEAPSAAHSLRAPANERGPATPQ
ncbi:MAG TPA: lysylphosphatidylglycerol synthase domain-containing protein [Phycisphaerales bacterium]|nr:lysylphosphatidylglycerol synthase domain-containing protein [Phycisphaerales bacterium]HMP37310.1 lysylphosphatidylglycerol synthase domain-containing protein [Phycisphaerales bacterium]